MKKALIYVLLVLSVSFISKSVLATPSTVVSDGSWLSYNMNPIDAEGREWIDSNYDDSGWRFAYENYPRSGWGLPADVIWDWPWTGTPDGTNGPRSAWFRKTFLIDGPVESALVQMAVDDDFDFYLNGVLVARNWDTTAHGIWEYDITSSLIVGENVIAIYAVDTYGGYEALQFYSTINTNPVPEPATMFLLGGGLVVMGGLRKKFRKN